MRQKNPKFPVYEELFLLAEKNKLWVEIQREVDGDNLLLSLLVKEKGENGAVLLAEPIDNILTIEEVAGKMMNKLGKKL